MPTLESPAAAMAGGMLMAAGKTTISQPSIFETSGLKRSMNSVVSGAVLYIFQLPARIGRLIAVSPPGSLSQRPVPFQSYGRRSGRCRQGWREYRDCRQGEHGDRRRAEECIRASDR